ncbi:hypothetical protein KM043_006922 [Ampulex compressa]|nr:hypothetical protein KM043_006922 [Ampulex compressa]
MRILPQRNSQSRAVQGMPLNSTRGNTLKSLLVNAVDNDSSLDVLPGCGSLRDKWTDPSSLQFGLDAIAERSKRGM